MTRLAAVVLAAGASTRMGRPKPLIEWRGRPFVWHVLEQARAAGAEPIVVVEGAVVLPREQLAGATIVRNEAWAEGPLGSLQVGLRAVLEAGVLEAGVDAPVLVLTVDRPHVHAATLQALARAVEADPVAIWQPRLDDRRGHPIVYPTDLLPALLALRPPRTPRDLLSEPEHSTRRRQVAVDDPAILDNLDRPDDLERLPP